MTPILVVDDVEENRYAMTRYLSRAGFESWEASTGADALRLAERLPAAVVLDVKLPDVRGFELCQTLKRNPRTASIPVLMVSAAFTKTEDRVEGLEGGADGYLVAPLNPQEFIATIRSLLRVRQAEASAHALSNQWQATFDAISDGICLLDREGNIERCNRFFCKIVRMESSEICGKPWHQFWFAQPEESKRLCQVFDAGARAVFDMEKGGRWYCLAVDPVSDADGTVSGAVCVVSDTTDRRRVEEQLRESERNLERRVLERTSELESSIKFMESFCYSIAHDLRAPLRSIKSFTTILLDDYSPQFDAEGKDYAQRIVNSAGRMDELIHDLLTYGRLNHVEISRKALDLEQEIDEVLSLNADSIARAQAGISVQRPMPEAWGDSRLLREALAALLSNAIKFVPPGTAPRVQITASSAQARVRLVFADNGVGVPKQHQHRVFNVFERLHTSDVYEGTGIGLAIVQKVAERMGGRAGVESEGGQGSRFWIELPEPPRESAANEIRPKSG